MLCCTGGFGEGHGRRRGSGMLLTRILESRGSCSLLKSSVPVKTKARRDWGREPSVVSRSVFLRGLDHSFAFNLDSSISGPKRRSWMMCVGLCFATSSSCLKYSDLKVSPLNQNKQDDEQGLYGIMNVDVIHGKASTGGNVEIPRDFIDPEESREITPLMTLTVQILLVTTSQSSPYNGRTVHGHTAQ